MKKLVKFPLILTLLLFIYLEVVGYIAAYLSFQLLSNIPIMSEWIGADYLNMLITELLPFILLLLLCKGILSALANNECNNNINKIFFDWNNLRYFLFLPVIVQIGWEISSLFLEKIYIPFFSADGITLFISCIIATFSIGLLEETVWRKIVFRAMRQKWGAIYGIIISSTLFGAVHFMNIITGGQDFGSTIIQVIQSIGFGMFLSSIYQITDNFILILLIHSACNFFSFFCNEMIGWNYEGYWWDNICRASFTLLYFSISIFIMLKLNTTERTTKK